MNKTPWTEADLSKLKTLVEAGKSDKELAAVFCRSIKSVETARNRNGLSSLSGFAKLGYGAPAVPVEDRNAAYWREEAQRLSKQLSKLSKSQTATDILVEEARALAPKSYDPAPRCNILKKSGKGSPQSAVLMLSDTHVGAVVRSSQTLGFGQYDFPTFLRRLKRLEDSVASILADHTTTPITELVLPIMGDILDGALTHGSEAAQVNTLFSQFYGAAHALAQFVRNLSAMVPKVRIYTVVGNHPRLPNQHKTPTKNRFSNIDHFTYAYLKALLRELPDVDFTLNAQPMAEFQVQGYNFLVAHGDVLRGGDKALGIPSHAIGRAVSATSQLRAKTGRPAINYYCYGHFHRAMELPHSLGRVLVNGGFPGVDEFGMAENFSSVPPVQKFFFMHPKFGISASYDLNLSFAKTEGIPYEVPTEFPVL